MVIQDADGDGYFEDEDCDDQNAQVNKVPKKLVLTTIMMVKSMKKYKPCIMKMQMRMVWKSTAVVVRGSVPEGYVPSSNDCDDGNANVFIGNNEECDGLDNNCDEYKGVGDIFYADIDADGYEDANTVVQTTSGFAQNDQDCITLLSRCPELCDGRQQLRSVSDDGGISTILG